MQRNQLLVEIRRLASCENAFFKLWAYWSQDDTIFNFMGKILRMGMKQNF